MSKHVLDRPRKETQVAVARLMAVASSTLPRRQTLSLQRRPRVRTNLGLVHAYRAPRDA